MSTTFSYLVPGSMPDVDEIAEWRAVVVEHRLHGLWLRTTPSRIVALAGRSPSELRTPTTFMLPASLRTADVESVVDALDGRHSVGVSLVIHEPSSTGRRSRSASALDEAAAAISLRRSRRVRLGANLIPAAHRAETTPDALSWGVLSSGAMSSGAMSSGAISSRAVSTDVDFVVVSASAGELAGSLGAGLRDAGSPPLEIVAMVQCVPRGALFERRDSRRRLAGVIAVRGEPARIVEQLGHFIVAGVDDIVISLDAVAEAAGRTAALEHARELARELPTERSTR